MALGAETRPSGDQSRLAHSQEREDRLAEAVRTLAPEQRGELAAAKAARDLLGRHYRKAAILGEVSNPQLITGFILEKLGILSPDPILVVRSNAAIRDSAATTSANLYDTDYFTPPLLQKALELSDLRDDQKDKLKHIINLLEPYRIGIPIRKEAHTVMAGLRDTIRRVDNLFDFYEASEYEASEDDALMDTSQDYPSGLRDYLMSRANDVEAYYSLKGDDELVRERVEQQHPFQILLHELLAYRVAANIGRPRFAYRQGQLALQKAYQAKDLEAMFSTSLTVDVLKSKGDEDDRFAEKPPTFTFNRMRALLLSQAHLAILAGGSPNSGKSSAAVCLYEVLLDRLYQDIKDGPLEYGDIKVDLCDLDAVAHTSHWLVQGKRPLRGPVRRWTSDRTQEALLELDDKLRTNNIVIVDLPGGSPDQITRALAERCHFSILIDRSDSDDKRKWRTLLHGDDLPQHLADIVTILDPERKSGLIRYDSTQKGRTSDFVWARVANLTRESTAPDQIMLFLADYLFYDSLPNAISAASIHRENHLTIAGERKKDKVVDAKKHS